MLVQLSSFFFFSRAGSLVCNDSSYLVAGRSTQLHIVIGFGADAPSVWVGRIQVLSEQPTWVRDGPVMLSWSFGDGCLVCVLANSHGLSRSVTNCFLSGQVGGQNEE